MSFLVTNCFDWIGFHIINYLVENGYQVDGFDNTATNKKENLAMMVGRNDLFSLLQDKKECRERYTAIIINGSNGHALDLKADKMVKLCRDEARKEGDAQLTTVMLPLLFGEWMPMNEKGMYAQNRFVPFDSDVFLNDAIYIEDFVLCLMQIIQSNHLPSFIELRSVKDNRKLDKNSKRFIFLRDIRPIEKNVKKVQDHYNRFKTIY
ncbi:hypothetical protein F3157_07075 [Virgibacillus dakarensis]|uniref:NAD(P)-binding domain-containing protein n=1 Tax=Lentibacillus populi TaxID=1827502 RepID=A0A9W5TX43_9BACI|nr:MULTISPECIES: hypothetical protein [Bacillaceae]MTW85423.1 hypothetical protein [Virgibacillus dakarensis]GGB39946.1 hypothetical protein GCM10011409_16850 [Lentibacillus populi]